MAFGFLAGILTYPVLHHQWYLFIPFAMLGSLLPDVDHENSKINRAIPVTRWVPRLFKHRGFFHSIFPVILIYAGFHYANLDILGIPLAVGYLAHLFSDCLTRMGCNLLHPLSTFRVQGFIYTNGAMELMTLGGVMVLSGIVLLKRFL